MIRTIISLEESAKTWLDKKAAEEGVPMTELIRRAVDLLRLKMEAEEEQSIDELLSSTKGLWKQGDGLEYQERLRSDW